MFGGAVGAQCLLAFAIVAFLKMQGEHNAIPAGTPGHWKVRSSGAARAILLIDHQRDWCLILLFKLETSIRINNRSIFWKVYEIVHRQHVDFQRPKPHGLSFSSGPWLSR
jgi:hypothetical protein